MRVERDSMGDVTIPDGALWGAQTQRAVENFAISGLRFGRRFIHALGWVKKACAQANSELGLLDRRLGEAIVWACDEVIDGQLDGHFPIDVFQTGSGTSTNMNANEVIANRATQRLGGQVGSKHPVHPNDHVNMSQSSNDVIPTAIHVAAVLAMGDDLVPALEHLREELAEKARSFDPIVKTGRTHLQDATPIRLGQEFGGYATQAEKGIERARKAMQALNELPLGGTAVGTGINCPPGFPQRAIAYLNEALGTAFIEAKDHVEANAARDGIVEASGQLKAIAVSLTKIANDIRWLGSGPRNGLGELRLPAVQPGSSIMPGKVNPVMAEALIMVAAQVIGYDAAITLAGLGSYFELNVMMPLMAHDLLSAIDMLASAVRAFTDRCVAGIEADAARCQDAVERNLALATALAPIIGYDRAAEVSAEAYRTGRTVRQIAIEWGVLPPDQLEAALDPYRMTEPNDFPPATCYPAAFDAKAKAWDDYTATPLGRLRQELTLRHLMQHLGSPSRHLEVLDAGGGTGGYVLPLVQQGHQVCLLDFSTRMLALARRKVERVDPSLVERMEFCCAPVEETARLFPPHRFDLILCHTLLEYVPQLHEVLCALAAVLRPGGLLSLLFVNPCADALRWALARCDLDKARLALREQISSADLFGLPRFTFRAETVRQAMAQAKVEVVAHYGIRIFADYLPAEKLADPEFFAHLLELEMAAAALHPYRLIARYTQLLGRKQEAS
jgi:fumarate hydratase class II